MNRRRFMGVVGGILGFLGFAKLPNNANANPNNLPVVKFNNDNGYCCNYEEIFKDIPFNEIKGLYKRQLKRERHVWVRQEDGIFCLGNDRGSYWLWGEVNALERTGYAYCYFEECPQSSKVTCKKRYGVFFKPLKTRIICQ